jgi:NAD dependent epimerase/dehydratase family enzyme
VRQERVEVTVNYEELEERRLDLVEREVAIKERLLEREVVAAETNASGYQKEREATAAHREKKDAFDEERAAAWDAATAHLQEHSERTMVALERLAAAMEAKGGG